MSKKCIDTEDELQALLSDKKTRRRGFDVIVRQYSAQVYWQLRRMVYDHDDANDLVQNTFIKAWEALDTFRGESKISTWLYRIAMHEGLNFLKQEQRKQSVYMRADDDDTAAFFMERLTRSPFRKPSLHFQRNSNKSSECVITMTLAMKI